MGAVWNHYRRAAPDVKIFNFTVRSAAVAGGDTPRRPPAIRLSGPALLVPQFV
jgi:hypothetical protein